MLFARPAAAAAVAITLIITASWSPYSATLELDELLREQERSVLTDADLKQFYRDVGVLRYRVPALRLGLLTEEEKSCAGPELDLVEQDLLVLGEYFSVSNDAAVKMMVGDAFEGQKLQFARQGIASARQHVFKILRCAAP
jgi:hypothetical protein